jgi:hypothetical protein
MLTLEPSELVRAAGRLTELVFSHEYGNVPWLLVRLAPGDNELAAGLHAADANAAAVRPPGQIAFHTEASSDPNPTARLRRTRTGRASFRASATIDHVVPDKRTDVGAAGTASHRQTLNRTSSSAIRAFRSFMLLPPERPDRCTRGRGQQNGTLSTEPD